MEGFQINTTSSLPKYKQIVDFIEGLITSKKLLIGDKLPSLNEIKTSQKVSRDTVLTAFNELKNKGIIQSVVGKGYYVISDQISSTKKLFLLFDEMNAFKEELYNSIIKHLDKNIQVEVFFHHFNEAVFQRLIHDSMGNYEYYVIMPGNIENAHYYIRLLPKENVFLLDQINNHLQDYSAVYQDFGHDIYEGLVNCLAELQQYEQLNLILTQKQPAAFSIGFSQFCADYDFKNSIRDGLKDEDLKQKQVYLVFEDKDLINIIKMAKGKGWESGKDFGLISYNETPLKDVIEKGITTLSTDFYEMGKIVAEMVSTNSNSQIKNRFHIYKRNSL